MTNSLPRKHRQTVAILLASSILVFAFAGLLFQPELVSIYWHIRFGDSAPFHEWSVPVPRGWYAFTRDDQLIIQKMLRLYDREDPPGIIVGTANPAKPLNVDKLKQAVIQTFLKDGYIFQQDRPIYIGAEEGFCEQFTNNMHPHSIRIACESSSAAFFRVPSPQSRALAIPTRERSAPTVTVTKTPSPQPF